ncbi:hypothetical protein DNC80_09905 [Flavobacterium sp. SOK18b]|uniref:PAS domain S-box protein n=1 Tax=Flavobacterium sp. SOK18b TaxID=797900 RepID=UPI0015FC5FEC|nr:PAS domain S-box protein [Flavobacterium sp. SOK18b]MBB1193976.1 hypothetical protein [Flavobacterium sp. SOK18b]
MSYLKTELYELIKQDNSIFDFIQETALDGLSYWDIENPENSYMNPKFWSKLGYNYNDLPSHYNSWKNIVNKDDAKLLQEVIIKNISTVDFVYEQIFRFTHQNGTTIWMKCYGKIIQNPNGNEKRLLGAHIDITYLKEQEVLLENCNSAARIGYWEFDILAQKIYWSKITKEIHEVSENYIPNLETAIHFYKEGDNRDIINIAISNAIKNNEPFDYRLQIITAKGNHRWIRTIGQTVFIEGRCTKVYGTFQDITIEKNAKIELIKEKEKLQSVLEATNLGTWEWNVQTDEALFNNRWAEIIGYTLEELQPVSIQTWIDLVHPEDLLISQKILEECFSKKREFYHCECRMKHKNGEWVWILDHGRIISWTEEGLPIMMYGTHSDITETKKKFERNKLFIEQTPTAIAMFDKQLKYIAASEKWCTDYGLQRQEIIGKSHYEIFPEIGDNWKKIHQHCLTGAKRKKEEEKFIRQDGSFQWLKWEVKPWYSDSDTIGGLIMLTEDITPRKKIQEQLLVSEEAFRGSFESAAIGMALLNIQGQWLKVNKNLCEITGYTNDELMQLTFQDITHPDDLEKDIALRKKLVEGKINFYHLDKRYICKDGTFVYVILASSIVRDSENNPLYIISQIINISSQKNAENKLEQAVSKLQGILDASTQVAIIETNIDGLITTFNTGAENLLGFKKEEVINLKTPETIHLQEEIEAQEEKILIEKNIKCKGFEVFTHVLHKGKFETSEWTYVKKDGTQFPVQLTVTAVKRNNEITGYLMIAVDISSIKKVENEIQSLLFVTKDQNERLKNFAHIVSHNLRSHSGNIAMMLELLLYENPAYADNEIIQLLDLASKNLKDTIGHLNEVVIMNTTITENIAPVNLNNAIENSIHNIQILAKNAHVKILNEVKKDVSILGIPAYVESILLNFLSNSIKYKSDKRKAYIKLNATVENDKIVLSIEDNGLGIDLKQNGDKLFGMYKTFHMNEDARGIGLFITKNQIEAIGGKITVTSEVDKGTTFKLYFQNA